MKQRLLVMNGQLLVQIQQADQWQTERVEKAESLKPGIYPIYLAVAAEKNKIYDGPIIHIDKAGVYQQIGKSFVVHEHGNFAKLPDLGADLKLSYDKGHCVATPSAKRSGRKIS